MVFSTTDFRRLESGRAKGFGILESSKSYVDLVTFEKPHQIGSGKSVGGV